MLNRRLFLQRTAATAAATPLLGLLPALALEPEIESLASLPADQYWKTVRKLFPMPADEVYFNTGTLGVQPKAVLEKVIAAMRDAAVNCAKTDYQGKGPLLLSGYEPYVDLRKKIAALINASSYQEIALTQNATYGMNYVSNGLDLRPGDEIINTDQEHGGGRAGWQVAAARYGLVYKQAKLPVPANAPQEVIDSIMSQVTPKTRIIAIPHILSLYGVILPVKEICRQARERGIFTILDGAQAVGQIPVDVQDIGCDAYYSSLHKWLLAPAGNGILFLRKEVVKDVWTTLASYQWENHDDEGFRFTQRGTGNPALIVGLEAAVDFHNQLGPRTVTNRIKFLGDYLRNGLRQIPNVEIFSSIHPEMCAGITTYGIKGIKGVDLQNELWKRKKLQPRASAENAIRHSTHIYNLEHEIDAALEIVGDLAKRG
ncbi:MAG: aminotransferase class V-fold PLP-dependent enzyme [Haliscomenobacter sp.]|nr:aminotransferase class V-fold PLP-dependent enzyme [Haliscomenobacter sp.]